jgi:hypothetical protein
LNPVFSKSKCQIDFGNPVYGTDASGWPIPGGRGAEARAKNPLPAFLA